MEMHQLRYVIAIADSGNFTRAAELSFITQPSLSQQIKKLEEELGHKLFHRLGRRAVITEAGQNFLERARRILAEVDDAVREIRDDPSLGRRIVIGAIPTVAPYLLPPLIDRARTQFPHLQVHTREDFRTALVHATIEGELDLALCSQPVRDHRLDVEPLFSEPLLLVVGKQSPLAKKPEIIATDLADQTFILLGDSSTLTMAIQRFCGDHDFEPRIGHRCSQIATVKALVSYGLGISILPQVTRHLGDRSRIVYRELSGRAPHRDIAVIRHRQRYQNRGAEQFLSLIRESVKPG